MLRHSDVVKLFEESGKWYTTVLIKLMLAAERFQRLDHESELRFMQQHEALEEEFLKWLEILEDAKSIPRDVYPKIVDLLKSAISKGSWSDEVKRKVRDIIHFKYACVMNQKCSCR